VARRPFRITTPEGVSLRFELAEIGDRLGAFLLDSVLSLAMVFALWLLLRLGNPDDRDMDGWLYALVVVLAFFVQNFYFIWFELRGAGMTPGKRRAGIRVISAEAGPLRPEAVVVRNLTRMLELHLPILVLFSPEMLWPESPGWGRALASVWVLIFAGLPFLNRHRMRIGDIVAGTRVVFSPPVRLLSDLGARRPGAVMDQDEEFSFTPAQLKVYGIYELQVLEHLLRQARDAQTREAMVEVARRIRRKIGWEGKIARNRVPAFLRAFYGAMRAHQEQRLLFGRRKEHKHAKERRTSEGE
jgi:uncharacterized RDD family membrane protein YckC